MKESKKFVINNLLLGVTGSVGVISIPYYIKMLKDKIATIFGQENVFYDSWSIQPGDGIIDKMNEGLSKCKFFFFVSKKSLDSKLVKIEWQNALYKATNNQIKLIPVKLDDCLMPDILIQSLYIDFYSQGPEVAFRQMVDVINGKNTFQANGVKPYQNIRTYISQENADECKIEFRAETYMEPQSKYTIFVGNSEDEVQCNVEGLSLPMQVVANAQLSDGTKGTAFIVSRSNTTMPAFPFIVRLKRLKGITNVITVMHAISNTQAKEVRIMFEQ